MGDLKNTLCTLWIDVETTGLDTNKHCVHQVAGMVYIDGELQEQFNLEFIPHPDAEVQKEALAVSNLTPEKVAARELTSEDAYHILKSTLETYVNKYDKEDKFFMGGYNTQFDAGFINSWFNRHGNKFFFGLVQGGSYLDAMQLTILLELKEGRRIFTPNRKLVTVAKIMGVSLENAHDALADIHATREVFIKLWEALLK